jgi:hypothetical protein
MPKNIMARSFISNLKKQLLLHPESIGVSIQHAGPM